MSNVTCHMSKPGFTLIEIILVVALIALFAGITIPLSASLNSRNDLYTSTSTVVHSLRRAQLLAQASDGDSPWGVKLALSNGMIFKGTSYSTRDTNYDEVTVLPGDITVSGITEVVYSKFTGLPQTTGNIILTSVSGSSTITINAKGMISY